MKKHSTGSESLSDSDKMASTWTNRASRYRATRAFPVIHFHFSSISAHKRQVIIFISLARHRHRAFADGMSSVRMLHSLQYLVSKPYLVVVDNSQNTPAQFATPLTVHSPVLDQRYALLFE